MTLTSAASLPPKHGGRPLHRQPLIVIPYLLSMAVALFWPEEGWRNVVLDAVADFFVTHIPSVNAYVQKSDYPEVMRAYFSVTFFIFISGIWVMMRNKDSLFLQGFEGQLDKYRASRASVVLVLFLLLLFLFLIFVLYAQGGYQFNIFPIMEKRWALAVFGPAVGWLSVHVMLAMSVCHLRFLFALIFK